MKQLKHNFPDHNPDTKFVAHSEICKYCSCSARNLYLKVKNNAIDSFPEALFVDAFRSQCEWFDKYAPCITEEEFIIKSIIE